MFKSNTVFIVGAGASKEAGLPTGAELIPIIQRKVNFKHEGGYNLISGDPELYQTLLRNAQFTNDDVNKYGSAGRRIAAGILLANSIDDFMDMHRDDKYIRACGKLVIAQTILEAERGSKLQYDWQNHRSPNLDALSSTWFVQFMRILRQGVSKGDIKSLVRNVSFVIFNYDRCIEHFLFHSVQAAYGVDATAALEIVRSLHILHPYGSVGGYSGSPHATAPWDVPFGFNGVDLNSIANNIRTYTEQIEETDSLRKMRTAIQEAETLVFLGFAFHTQNMKLISPGNATKARRVYATGLGLSGPDALVVDGMIRSLVGANSLASEGGHIHVVHKTCHDLFLEYWRSLSA